MPDKKKGKKVSMTDMAEHRVETPRSIDERLLQSGLKEGYRALLPFVGGQISAIERKDGKLELLSSAFERAVSADGGKTWGEIWKMDMAKEAEKIEHGGRYPFGWIRLPSGRIGMGWYEEKVLPGRHKSVKLWWRTSEDEGKTWSKDIIINPTGEQGRPYYDTLRITRTGRLLLPVRWCFNAGEMHYTIQPKGAGWHKDKKIDIEGHGHFPEIDITYVYYSDDEGKTWSRCEGEVMGWLYRGWNNYVGCDEPNLEELKDGRLIMLMRTTIGRLLQSFSEDGGEHWSIPEPTSLASSYSPCALKKIPQTGDLLVVWNQVSADEIRLGYRRGRLSCAISEDGINWKNFRTLEVHGLLAQYRGAEQLSYKLSGGKMTQEEKEIGEIERIYPEEKLQLCRALSDVGQLHPDWGMSDYPTIYFYQDKVFIFYPNAKGIGKDMKSSLKMRILPVEWLYKSK